MIRLSLGAKLGEKIPVWWKNYCHEYDKTRSEFDYIDGTFDEKLQEWGAWRGAGGTLVFENDRDATTFIIRWS